METFMQDIYLALEPWLGLDREPKELTFPQIALRGTIIFFLALVMVRIGDKRFFAKRSAFDVILAFMLASVLARAVNGSAPFFETIGGAFVLILLHRFMGHWAYHSHRFSCWIKGEADRVIEGGQLNRDILKKHHISDGDLLEDLRLQVNKKEFDAVEEAWLERNGQISFIPKKGDQG